MADQWLKGKPAGTDNASDIDTLVQANNSALDRLLANYRENCYVKYASASTVTIGIGSVVCSNSDGSVRVLRQNTTAVTLDLTSDLDVGAEAVSTYYYIYAVADTDATTFTGKISLSSTAPTGVTYYKKLGYFYNNSSGDIVNVGNFSDTANFVYATAATDITTTSTTYADMDSMVCYFVSNGRPVEIKFTGIFSDVNGNPSVAIDVDGTDKIVGTLYHDSGAIYGPLTLFWAEILSAGTHTIKVQWKTNSGTTNQYGSTHGGRILMVEEK
jgi:hypothetical protein